MAGVYHRASDTYDYVEFCPDEWKSHGILSLLKQINNLKGTILFKSSKNFQRNAIRKWNPYYDQVCELFIPKVMLHDQITTDGYGKCIIEVLTIHGILDKVIIDESKYEWKLSENWDKKQIILCLDGLSLDRHRGFANKLLKLPMLFTH